MDNASKRENVADRLFNFRPLFFSAASLALGVVFAYFHIIKDVSAWWSLTLLPFAVTSFLFCKTAKRAWRTTLAVGWLCACFCFGFSGFKNEVLDFDDARQFSATAEVVGCVREKECTDYMLTVVLDGVQVDGERQEGRVLVYLSKSYAGHINRANVVRIRGFLQTNVSLFNQYGFRANDISKDLRFSLSKVEEVEIIGRRFDPFAVVRNKMERTVYAGMDETSAAVTMAVLTGDTSGIDSDLLGSVRRGGIAHIFAVSGLHVGALYAFCLLIMKRQPFNGLSRTSQFLILAFVLVFYAGVCGFTASVVRALILCLLAFATKTIGVKGDLLESLGLAAFLILLFKPVELFSVGFQISFAACLGIAFLAKPLGHVCNEGYDRLVLRFAGKRKEEILQRRKERENLPPTLGEALRKSAFSLLAVSIAVQIATMPILLQVFGYVSGWSLLLNLIFVPAISASFSLLLLFVFVACLLPVSAASVILYLPAMLWSAVLLLFETFDFSSFTIAGVSVTAGGWICYYLACTFFSDKWNLSKKWRRAVGYGLVAAFGVTVILLNIVPIL